MCYFLRIGLLENIVKSVKSWILDFDKLLFLIPNKLTNIKFYQHENIQNHSDSHCTRFRPNIRAFDGNEPTRHLVKGISTKYSKLYTTEGTWTVIYECLSWGV